MAPCFIKYQDPPIAPFVQELRAAVRSGNETRLKSEFLNKEDSDYLFRMASDRGGLRKLELAVIPAPPGWEQSGRFWAVIHTRQDIEEHHDPVYPIIVSHDRFVLGPEIPEDCNTGIAIKHAKINAHIQPERNAVDVQASLIWSGAGTNRAPILRLNDNFILDSAVITEGRAPILVAGDSIPSPHIGDVVRAGSLLIPWLKGAPPQGVFDYHASIDTPTEDKITAKACYLTAWWVPSINRLPFTTQTRVQGPAAWVLQSEGEPISREASELNTWPIPPTNEKEAFFRCDIPISFPKVVGGNYVLAAGKTLGGRILQIYHFEPVDKVRAQKDLDSMVGAIQWYDANLGQFPFKEYKCYDADTYYGIESYNYTLLRSDITSWAVGHEAGHTYFGGLVPCPYVQDSWNESMTQYVDSVLRQGNNDRSLQAAYASLKLHVSLTQMPVAHEYNSATYYRGAFVLRMLENQIGREKMLEAIRALIKDRRGKDTTWYSLRPYFENVYGAKLDWFWRQWISNADFPTLELTDAQGIATGRGTKVLVTVRQSGTPNPFRLRFKVWAKSNNGQEVEQVVEMNSPEAVFELNLGQNKAYEAGIETLGYVLAAPPASRTVKF